jgi:DNA-binding HxlR family transcriptional regulator
MRGKPTEKMKPGTAQSVAEVLRDHVVLELEGIDRMYLNVYVPRLQTVEGVLGFIRRHRGHKVASTAMVEPITRAFVSAIDRFVAENGIPVVNFEKGQRKDDVAARFRTAFTGEEGVLFVGKAQEKCRVYRTEKRRNPKTGVSYAWIVKSTAMVNHYYFYCVDRDFGPFFLKFCSYFPYSGKLCLNGHEYAKRQLERAGIEYEALDNGVLSCRSPRRLQSICNGLSAAKIDALLRKWLAKLPHPFTAEDRKAGYRYDLSILQMELSLTQVLDRPVSGRIFFEQVIRENLDIGRPKQVQLIFEKWVTKRSPGTFRTRVITDGVIPSLHVDYKGTRIKQYHKEGQALRTETTINNARDFYIGKRLCNLDALRQIGFQANRRLLEVEKISHDCILTEEQFQRLHHSLQVGQQRVSALRFGDRNVQALWHALVLFDLLPTGFSNGQLRLRLAPLLGLNPEQLTPGKMTYHLRRLRLHGLVERIPHTHRYRLTSLGLRVTLFFTRTYDHLLRPGLGAILPHLSRPEGPLRRAFDQIDQEVNVWIQHASIAA